MTGDKTSNPAAQSADKPEKIAQAGAGSEHHVWAHAAQEAYAPGTKHTPEAVIDGKHPLKGLNDSRIEKSPDSDKAPDGKPLPHRDANQATELHVRVGHKDGDPPPNYTVDVAGHIKEVRHPDTKLHPDDHSIVIEAEGDNINKAQLSATTELVKSVEKTHHKLNRADDMPPNVREQLESPANIPQIPHIPPEHRGGHVGAPNGPKNWGGPGGTQGGNGGPRGGEFFGDPSSAARDHSPPVDWSKVPGGGFNPDSATDRVGQLISSNEGRATSINWNDNGAGVSVGMFQANQRQGELPMLFAAIANNPEGYKELVDIFGPELAAKIKAHPEIVRGLDFEKGNKLGHELEKLVQSPHFQELQLKMLREKVAHAGDVAKQHGIESTAGVAIVADMINQFGEAGAAKYLGAADRVHGQEDKARAIVQAVRAGSKYGPRYVADMKKLDSNGLSFDDKFTA